MKKFKFIILTLTLNVLLFVNAAFAGCWVEDGTFYSNSKSDMIRFVIAMQEGEKQKALKMVDEGRINSCSQASAFVLERDKTGVVNVNILGIGKVWIFHTFLHCR